jgi:hypothetical protein
MISVTTVLQKVGLVDVSGPWFTDEARDRGSALHLATHYHDEGYLDESTLIDERVRARFAVYKQFHAEVNCEVLYSELEVKDHDLGLIGHIDKVVRIAGRAYVLDIKPPGSHAWHPLQLAAYAKLLRSSGVLSLELAARLGRLGLYIGDTNFRLVKRDSPQDWPIFRAALTVAQFMEANRA